MNGIYIFESLSDGKEMVVLQFLKISLHSVIPNRFYVPPKLKNWMCEMCAFSQIWSHLMTALLESICDWASKNGPSWHI